MEEEVRKALWEKGIKFRKNVKDLPGKADIAIKKYHIVIFVDSCFWHACPYHGRVPKININFWTNKLNRNKERDIEINNYYLDKGWHIRRVWEHELKEDFVKVIDSIDQRLKEAKKKS